MPFLRTSEPLRALRIGSAFLLCGLVAVILVILGQSAAAGGAMIGFVLFAVNAWFLVETGRALLGGERRGARAVVAVSAIGRFLLVGLALGAVFVFLGRPAGLGACGGLFLSQVNLHFPIRRTGVAT